MRATAIDPEARLTPNRMSELLRELSGGRHTVSPKKIREAIHTGELKSRRVGRWNRIRWGDALEWLEGKAEATPAPPRGTERRSAESEAWLDEQRRREGAPPAP